jgi:hypothetical protein
VLDLIKALLPSICIALLFWYVMRGIVRADRTEREQIEKFYSEHEVSELDDNGDSGVMLTPVKSSENEKSEHGTGDATRSHG